MRSSPTSVDPAAEPLPVMLEVGRAFTVAQSQRSNDGDRRRGGHAWFHVPLITSAETQNTAASRNVNLLMPPLFTPNVSAPTPPKASARPPPFDSCSSTTMINSTD